MANLADAFLKDFDAETESSRSSEASDAEEDVTLFEGGESEEPSPDNAAGEGRMLDLVEGAEPGDCGQKLLENAELTKFVGVLEAGAAAVAEKAEGSPGSAETEVADLGTSVACLRQVNEWLQKVDSEILRLFQKCKEIYGRRFPELEALLPAPLDYLSVMRTLGNELEKGASSLNGELANAAVLAISVAASASVGTALSEAELNAVIAAAAEVDGLVEVRQSLIAFTERSMASAAPNLTAIVGASLAARLVGHAGGLEELATMPSQNLLVVGGSSYARRTAAITAGGGDSAGGVLPAIARNAGKGYGVIYECDLVESTQPAFRARALRLVSGKAALAVRKDVFNNDGTNTVGRNLRQTIVEKLTKCQKPPPARMKKPLPVPEEQLRAKRGGRRKRRWKEKYGLTEIRKKANRLQVTINEPAEPERLQNEDDDDDDVF